MTSMAALRPLAVPPSSRCAAARPQALQASKVGAGSPDPQAGAAPELPSRGGGEEQARRTNNREDSAAHRQT